MLRLTVEHKYCKCTRVIEGETITKAYKENNTDMSIWQIIDIEKI